MGFAYASGIVAAPVDEVWELVRRFDALPLWHPFVETCEMADGAHPATVGAQRIQRLANGGDARATLVALDDVERTLVYEMLDGPWSVHSYIATVRLHPVTDQNVTFAEWSGRFEADAAELAEITHDFRTNTYEAGVLALQNWFGSSRQHPRTDLLSAGKAE